MSEGQGGGGAGSAGSGGGIGDECTTSSNGEIHCPDERQRYAAWDSYAIGDDGRTVTVAFRDVPAPCVQVDELRADVLPTEIHLTLSLLDIQQGCGDTVVRDASVKLSEPVAGRPVYSAIIGGGEGGTGARGYAGSASGPQCHGPNNPAPGAFVTDCPAPTAGPPPPLRTVAESDVKRAHVVPWTAITVADDDRTVELQWISTDCARLKRVRVTHANTHTPSVLIGVYESACKGATVVRSTTLRLDAPISDRPIVDETHAIG